jgi:hypothetical protein
MGVMMWLTRHRRLIAVLTLLSLFAPAAVMAATVRDEGGVHRHMHHDSHVAQSDAVQLEVDGHDRLLCSIIVPCEHGFCAGLAISETDSRGLAFDRVWISGEPSSAHPATPEALSPPPRSLS